MICPIPHDATSVKVVFAKLGGGESTRRISVEPGHVYRPCELIERALATVKRLRTKHQMGVCLRIECGKARIFDYLLDVGGM